MTPCCRKPSRCLNRNNSASLPYDIDPRAEAPLDRAEDVPRRSIEHTFQRVPEERTVFVELRRHPCLLIVRCRTGRNVGMIVNPFRPGKADQEPSVRAYIL